MKKLTEAELTKVEGGCCGRGGWGSCQPRSYCPQPRNRCYR
jgi:bacteriocin-like protein